MEWWRNGPEMRKTPVLQYSITSIMDCAISAVQRIDISRAIQLCEQTGVDEIFRIRILSRWNPLADIVDDRLEAVDRWIRLGSNDFTERLIRVFGLLFVFSLAIPGKSSLR